MENAKITKKYRVALGLIVLFTVFGQLVIQYFLKKNEGISKVINIAGRQRMYSQKIAKLAYLYPENSITLNDTWKSFKKSHYNLLQGKGGLDRPYSQRILSSYKELTDILF